MGVKRNAKRGKAYKKDGRVARASSLCAEICTLAGTTLSVDTLWFGLSAQQLAEHELQNAAIGVVLRLLGSIDTHQTVEFGRLAVVGGANCHLSAGSEFIDQLTNADNFEHLIAGQAMRLCVFSGEELQGKNSHANQIRAMDALVAFRNHGSYTQKKRAFRRPVS